MNVRQTSTNKFASAYADDLAYLLSDKINTLVLDFDDTFYHPSTNVHQAIKALIVADAGVNPDIAGLCDQWRAAGNLHRTATVQTSDLGWAFPAIVNWYRQRGTGELSSYLRRVYDVAYDAIAPQPDFVAALKAWRGKGRRVVLYTNGPWTPPNEAPLHVNKGMERIGFPSNFFVEADIIDLCKIDRNPALLMRYGIVPERAFDLFNKNRPEGFRRAMETLVISDMASLAFFDDSPAALASARDTGALLVHVNAVECREDKAACADYTLSSTKTDVQGHYFSAVGLLLENTVNRPYPPIDNDAPCLMSRSLS